MSVKIQGGGSAGMDGLTVTLPVETEPKLHGPVAEPQPLARHLAIREGGLRGLVKHYTPTPDDPFETRVRYAELARGLDCRANDAGELRARILDYLTRNGTPYDPVGLGPSEPEEQ